MLYFYNIDIKWYFDKSFSKYEKNADNFIIYYVSETKITSDFYSISSYVHNIFYEEVLFSFYNIYTNSLKNIKCKELYDLIKNNNNFNVIILTTSAYSNIFIISKNTKIKNIREYGLKVSYV